jgi:hypothetical protein
MMDRYIARSPFSFYKLVLVVSKVICNREYPEIAMINMILMHLELSRRGQRGGSIATGRLLFVPPFYLSRYKNIKGTREGKNSRASFSQAV